MRQAGPQTKAVRGDFGGRFEQRFPEKESEKSFGQQERKGIVRTMRNIRTYNNSQSSMSFVVLEVIISWIFDAPICLSYAVPFSIVRGRWAMGRSSGAVFSSVVFRLN